MENVKQNKVVDFYFRLKNSQIVEKINNFICGFWGLFTMAVIAFFAYALAIEIVFYSLVCIYTIYVCLFSKDFLPLVPLFVFCYIVPSSNNNPGRNEGSIFYNGIGIAILVIGIVCAVAIFTRIGLDKNMSFKKLFTQKLYLTISMLILGASYLVSGIFSDIYSAIWLKNLLFAFLQFLSFFLLYFIFAATIDWKKVSKDYLPYLALLMGCVVAFEVLHLYIFKAYIEFGSFSKNFIITGWGISNNIAAMITLAIPFVFYLAYTKKHSSIYLSLATFLLVMVAMTMSRASFIAAAIIYAVCFFICFFKAQNKKEFRITTIVIVSLLVVVIAIFFEKAWNLVIKTLSVFETDENGKTIFSDANRFKTYKLGLEMFANYPIFGNSFYARGEWPWQYSTIETITEILPARWHCTVIQLLTSTGIVGLLAYLYHRAKTILLLVKKPTIAKTFIGLSIVALIGMSLLDCHMFNIGPVLFYSIMLIFAEKLYTDNDCEQNDIEENKQNTNENIEKTNENKTENSTQAKTQKSKTTQKPKQKTAKSAN